MRKVPHRFLYTPPNIYNDFKHCISFRIKWRGSDYGQFLLFIEAEWECPYYCIRQLVMNKHYLLEQMDYIEQ